MIIFRSYLQLAMADDTDGTEGIAALASWLMLQNLLGTGTVTALMPSIADDAVKTLAFDKVGNPFIGIIAGVIGASCYNKFKGTQLPDWLSFFSGKRCVAIIAGVVSIVVAGVLLFVWPFLWLSCIRKRCCWYGRCWFWYLCFLEPFIDPIWFTSRIKQRILV